MRGSRPEKRGNDSEDTGGEEAPVRSPPSKRPDVSVLEVPCSSRQIIISSDDSERREAGALIEGERDMSDDASVIIANVQSQTGMELDLNQSSRSSRSSLQVNDRRSGSLVPFKDQARSAGEDSFYSTRTLVYLNYNFQRYNAPVGALPIYKEKERILDAISSSNAVVLIGFTGCGKTTQVPQFIVDSCRVKNEWCNIVVTQPRRIAAISTAKRVCFERNWEIGTVVGYKVRNDQQISITDTLITYVTTGVLLQQLVSEKSLRRYSHVIIDEVHERDLDTDYLLLVIKKIMMDDKESREQNTKIILMSATIDEAKFKNYFTFDCGNNDSVKAKDVKVLPTVSFKISDAYLDDVLKDNKNLLKFIDKGFCKEEPGISRELYQTAVQVIKDLDDIVMTENPDPGLRRPCLKRTKRGAVLVFLPGREEIRMMQKLLHGAEMEFRKQNGSYKWLILPLHSTVTVEEQQEVFEAPPTGFRKIILSTNIAESSITVEDVIFVLDFCLCRRLSVDQRTNLTTLKLAWAAKTQCIQRRGRAGRVTSGHVIKMVTKRCYREYIDDEIEPEMNRCNLENIILWCKLFSPESPVQLLSYALDKPQDCAIKRTVSTLKKVGALTINKIDLSGTGTSVYDPYDGDLTFVGEVMATLPISLNFTRLILFGRCFGVLEQAIIIAAALSAKNPFCNFENPLESYTRKCEFSGSTYSDLFALLNLYQKWYYTFVTTNPQNKEPEKKWATGLNVSLVSLREIRATVEEIRNRLNQLQIHNNFYVAGVPGDPTELSAEQGLFLKLSIAGAFYPNYFLRRKPNNMIQYEEQAWRETNQLDPFRTVVFNGFRRENIGRLYGKRIADYLSFGEHTPAITFDNSKVLATFDKSLIDKDASFNGTIFRAIKLRSLPNNRLRFPVFLSRIDDTEAIRRWDEIVRARPGYICPPQLTLPSVQTSSVDVCISNIISPSKFWVILKKDEEKFRHISQTIRSGSQYIFFPTSKLVPNGFCLAMRKQELFRGKIVRLKDSETASIKDVLIYFVDTGHTEWIRSSTLLDFTPEMIEKNIHKIPCLAIQCRLQEIKPNEAFGIQWCRDAVLFMERFCKLRPNGQPILHFQIFCVYESVMIGDIIGESFNPPDKSSLHQCLTFHRREDVPAFGRVARERYPILQNHRKRQNAMNMNRVEVLASNDWERGTPLDYDFPDPPEEEQAFCILRGPFSPLEMVFEALANCAREKSMRIENGSVNSVALDHDPATSVSRMLVAAEMGLIDKDRSIRVSETTIMPPVAGFASFSCLLFAPIAELRVDQARCKYTGVLSGCGTAFHENQIVPVNSDYDMENTFEVKIDDQDIDLVNHMRHQISSILMTRSNTEDIQKNLRISTIKLLKRKRDINEDEIWPAVPFAWDLIAPENFRPMEPVSYYHMHDILVPIQRISLTEPEDEVISWDLPY